jgi:hypothetical protein
MRTTRRTSSTKWWRGSWWVPSWRRRGGGPDIKDNLIYLLFFSQLLSCMGRLWDLNFLSSGYLFWHMFKIITRVVRAPLTYLADLRKLSFR